MLACCLSDGMLSVIVMAACEGVLPLLELVILFMVLYKCLVLVEWSSVHRKECQFRIFKHYYFVVDFCVWCLHPFYYVWCFGCCVLSCLV